MERGDASQSANAALDVIREIRDEGVSPAVSAKLDELARVVTGSDRPPGTAGQPRQFGAFAGKFSIGPEFFEPLSEAERQAWGED